MRAYRALAINFVVASMRNRVAMIFTLGLAFLFMVIFGLLFGGAQNVSVDVVNQDNTATADHYVSALRNTAGITATPVALETAKNDLQQGNVAAYIVIPQGFEQALAEPPGTAPHLQVQFVQPNQASATAGIAQAVVAQATYAFVAQIESAHGQPVPSPNVVLGAATSTSVHAVSTLDFFLPSMMAYLILQTGVNYVAIGLVDLRERQVLRRMRASPVRPASILASQITGGILTVLLQLVILVAVGLALFRATVYGSWLVALVPILLGTAAFVGIGFLLTSFASTSQAARGLAQMVALPLMFLSGIFFPITDLPTPIQDIMKIMPLSWLSDALHRVLNNGASLGAITGDCLVMAAWAVVTFAIATWRFRWE